MNGRRGDHPVTIALLASAICLLGSAQVVRAQDAWEWPETPQNLQSLPKDWPGSRLRPVMLGFTRALGVRCSHCHVGEEGQPLSTYDFASDENPKKNVARAMLELLGDVNEHLKEIEPSGPKRVNMWCHTCHRGRPRPMTLSEELSEKYEQGGVEEVLAHYRMLRNRYYGRGAYDFGEGGLNQLGYRLLRNGDHEDAIMIFKLNVEQNPESGNVYDSLAEAYMTAGNKELAIEFYEKAVEMDPANGNAAQKLEELKASRSGH